MSIDVVPEKVYNSGHDGGEGSASVYEGIRRGEGGTAATATTTQGIAADLVRRTRRPVGCHKSVRARECTKSYATGMTTVPSSTEAINLDHTAVGDVDVDAAVVARRGPHGTMKMKTEWPTAARAQAGMALRPPAAA
ncbi:hypothetical protein BGZ72_001622, partial [Mortierella alpina]